MSVRTRTTGFYRDDAARLAADAAKIAPPAEPQLKPRSATQRAEPQIASQRAASERAPAILIDEPQRPALAPEPAINQNRPADRHPVAQSATERAPVGRIIAWVLLAPFYAAGFVGCIAVLILAAKFFLRF